MTQLTLYSRKYCHLCADMLAQLEALQAELEFELVVRDIDDEPSLTARYDEWVPVLAAGHGAAAIQLCHYVLDAAIVRAYLRRVQQSKEV